MLPEDDPFYRNLPDIDHDVIQEDRGFRPPGCLLLLAIIVIIGAVFLQGVDLEAFANNIVSQIESLIDEPIFEDVRITSDLPTEVTLQPSDVTIPDDFSRLDSDEVSPTPEPGTLPDALTGETLTAEEYYQRGLDTADRGDYEAAIQDFTRAIELEYAPLNLVYYDRGTAYHNLGDYEAAIADYSRSIELDPDCENECYFDYNNRGVAYYGLGDLQAALADYSTAISFNPTYALAYNNRGYLRDEMGEPTLALSDWDVATTLRAADIVSVALASNDTLIETIQDEGQQFHIAIDAEAGTNLTAQTSWEGATLDTTLLLRGPDGTPLAFNDDIGDDAIDAYLEGILLPQSGTYTIVVASAVLSDTGTFSLYVAVE